MKDAKLEVLERLHGLAQLIRRRGTPEEAAEAVPYEQQFAKEVEERRRELGKQPELLSHQPEEKAA
jgi:hypothetical protein